MQKLQLPTTIQELQKTIKIAIEKYQGSPVKNQNKLNECTALGLGFKNYDSLSAALNNHDEKESLTPMTVNYSDRNGLVINGTHIESHIFDEQLVDYKLVDREETIEDLMTLISDAQNNPERQSDVFLMREDLEMLLGLEDEYVFSSICTNHFVSPTKDTEEFNSICKEMIDVQETLDHKFNNIIDFLFEF